MRIVGWLISRIEMKYARDQPKLSAEQRLENSLYWDKILNAILPILDDPKDTMRAIDAILNIRTRTVAILRELGRFEESDKLAHEVEIRKGWRK